MRAKGGGAKPKPTHLKLIAGNPGKRPLNADEPQFALGIPDPPKHLSAVAKTEWLEVAGKLHKAGVLTVIDRAALAAYCQAYGRWVQAERALAKMAAADEETSGLTVKTIYGNSIANPLVGAANKAMADMMRYCVEFGMTPSSRSRIHAQKPNEESDASAQYF